MYILIYKSKKGTKFHCLALANPNMVDHFQISLFVGIGNTLMAPLLWPYVTNAMKYLLDLIEKQEMLMIGAIVLLNFALIVCY